MHLDWSHKGSTGPRPSCGPRAACPGTRTEARGRLQQPACPFLNGSPGLNECPFSPISKGCWEAMWRRGSWHPQLIEKCTALQILLACCVSTVLRVSQELQAGKAQHLLSLWSTSPDYSHRPVSLLFCETLSLPCLFPPPLLLLYYLLSSPHPPLLPWPLLCSDKTPKKPGLIFTDIQVATDTFYLSFSLPVLLPFPLPLTPLRNMQAR